MYRDDAAALEERGAALEEQLAPLRVSGPPGAVVRIEELGRQLREVRRFGWAYGWLALLLPLAFVRVPSSAYLVPAALSVGSLWLELTRQRRARWRSRVSDRSWRATVRIASDEEARPEPDCVDDSLSPPARYSNARELP